MLISSVTEIHLSKREIVTEAVPMKCTNARVNPAVQGAVLSGQSNVTHCTHMVHTGSVPLFVALDAETTEEGLNCFTAPFLLPFLSFSCEKSCKQLY